MKERSIMNPLIVVFLGIIALGALVQAALLAALTVMTVKAGSRLRELEARARTDIPRWGLKAREVGMRTAALSARARSMAARAEGSVDASVARAQGVARWALRRFFPAVTEGLAVAHGVRKAVAVYQRMGGPGAGIAIESGGSRR
jgi:hypothetical protein